MVKQTILLFWQQVKRYPQLYIPLVVISPIVTIVRESWRPWIAAQVLERISHHAYNSHDLWGSFGLSLVLYALATFGSTVLGWRLIVWLVWQLELLVARDLSQKTFGHLLKMSANFHTNRFGGALVSQATKLASAYVRLVDNTLFSSYPLFTTLIVSLIILTPSVPFYAAMLAVLVVAFIGTTTLLSEPVRAARTIESEADSEQTGYLADSITNVMAVKSFAASQEEEATYSKAAEYTRTLGAKTLLWTMRRDTLSSSITSSLDVGALALAVTAVGVLHIDIATVFLIVSYTATISMRLWDFQRVLREYNRAFADAHDMTEILQIKPEIADPPHPEPLRIKRGAIAFQHVDFTHPGANQQALFHDLNLRVEPGEKIGLIGHSGSGKTTLTRLLLRFSDIDAGAITIDGQDIARITQDDLHRSISYVPQEPLLFHRTIRENIAYGKPGATEVEIAEAARKAYAHEFVETLPRQYDTLVGERGVKLSGGQRQRIAIARAILKDAPILVLDEATSALDSESERLIQAALGELMRHRSAIVIAHRLSTVHKMDRIIVLEQGRIVEQGAHQQLLNQKGIYSQLWTHQSGGFIEE